MLASTLGVAAERKGTSTSMLYSIAGAPNVHPAGLNKAVPRVLVRDVVLELRRRHSLIPLIPLIRL